MHIKVKGLNDHLIFVFDDQEKFENLMEELTSLLEKPMFNNKEFFPKAFFDFKSRILRDEELGRLLDILFEKQVVLFDGINTIEINKKSKIKVINRTIHAGEILKVTQDTLIIGHINAGAIVKFTGKLYVLGKVRGMVEGIGEDCQVSGQYFKNAHIRINNVSRHDYTSYELTMLYYRDNDIYLDKGEMIYV